MTICCFSFLATCSASKFTVAILPLAKEFNVTPTRAGQQVCFNVLLLGLGNIFWAPIMRRVGKRPIYLTAMALLVGTNVWSRYAGRFNSLLASSMLSGFASSAADATVPAVVADLFFVQQRGAAMMLFSAAMSGGFFIGPLISAFCVQHSGWRLSCTVIASLVGFLWVVSIFTLRETSYHDRNVYAPATSYGETKTFRQNLSITSGYNGDGCAIKSTGNLISILTYPGTLCSGLAVGAFIGGYFPLFSSTLPIQANIKSRSVAVQLASAQFFILPSYYSWQTRSLGLLSIAGFIGCAIALFFGGYLIDIISNRFTTSHEGRREPEYRLWAIIIPLIVGPMGIILFSLTLADHKPWIAPAVGYAMQGFGLTAASNILYTYILDSYLPFASEVAAAASILRGTIATLLTLWLYPWIKAAGLKQAFGQIVGIQYFLGLWVILFLFWGKRIRLMTARYGPMSRCRYARQPGICDS